MDCLLIGGAGYVGSTLARYVMTFGQKFTILDKRTLNPHLLHELTECGRMTYVHGDAADARTVYDLARKHDVVVYLASLSLNDSAKFKEDALFTNGELAKIVGDVCNRLGKRMVYISTCSNYGKTSKSAKEEHKLTPTSLYALTKVDTEKYLLGMDNTVILRCATAYGVGANYTRWDTLFNGFVSDGITKGKIDLYSPDASRPMIHVRDMADAIYQCCEGYSKPGVYNVGSNKQNYTKRQMAEVVKKATGCEINEIGSGDDRDYVVDFSKIYKIGFRATWTPFECVPELKEALEEE